MTTIKRLALGQIAGIGSLYDARQETFLTQSILTPEYTGEAVAVTNVDERDVKIVTSDTYREKLEKIGVSREFGSSLLADIVQPDGSVLYLSEPAQRRTDCHRGAIYTFTTRDERLNFMAQDVRNAVDLSILASSRATHIVTGVTVGAMAVVSARAPFTSSSERIRWEQDIEDAFHEVPFRVEDTLEEKDPAMPGVWPSLDDQTQVNLYTDLPTIASGPVLCLSNALRSIQQLKADVHGADNGLQRPVIYTLLPIGFLMTLGANISGDTMVGQLSPECYEMLVNTLDHIRELQLLLQDHYQRILQHRNFVSNNHREMVETRIQESSDALAKLYADYPPALEQIRGNAAVSQSVMKILSDTNAAVLSSDEITGLVGEAGRKLDFFIRMTGLGAMYPSEPFKSETNLINRYAKQHKTLYVFHISGAVVDPDDQSWQGNSKLLEETLTRKDGKRAVLIVDCDAYNRPLTQAYITVYTNGTLVVDDLLKQNVKLAEKPLIQYEEAALEATKDVPTYRKAVRIACPGQDCHSNEKLEWVCNKCHENVEFGSLDGYFYCDCGRVPYTQVTFHCQRKTHQQAYESYDRNQLQSILRNLPDPREVNILIMGETGVGKSTFVNAFINYLTFTSLDDGLKNPTLNWVIPCSFTTQLIDDDGRMLSKDVVIGKDEDEFDGSAGQSATQRATVYPLYFRDTIIRLIDTPGIGDTRGVDQDKKNMANMLSVLRNYTDLHGILILLKPNNARLGVMFRFCVKELLTHLHTSAAHNMVFGFTNTRGSNYTPGDTFRPLEKLLSQYKDVISGLRQSNVYCFDSESFRYLAAKKNGIEMGNIDDYRRSWEHSAKEARRLLGHFQSLHPHHTQQTLSLNETRHLISQLTMPMQQISVAITDTIAKNSRQISELRSAELTSTQLKSRLHIQKTTINVTPLTKPKTVCAHEECVEPFFDEGSEGHVILRKNLCHNPCCLTNVPVGQVGTPELKNCAAFHSHNDRCRVCTHHWNEHEHIIVEYEKKNETTTDSNVQRELDLTGNVISAKESMIKQLEAMIKELQHEHSAIQEAAAKFSLYLKSNSITHYNDETVEYMEHLIRDERTKARTSQNRSQIDTLEASLKKYRQFIQAMEQGKGSGKGKQYQPLDEQGIALVVQGLYNLPHYGANLKTAAEVVGRAYEANFRERPYRISKKKYWKDERETISSSLWPDFMRRLPIQSSRTGTLAFTRPGPSRSNKTKYSAEHSWPLPSSSNKSTDLTEHSWLLPSSSSTEARRAPAPAPAQSISDWNNSYVETTQNPFEESVSSDPPPYSAQYSESSPSVQIPTAYMPTRPTEIVEKKGKWIRFKNKMKSL